MFAITPEQMIERSTPALEKLLALLEQRLILLEGSDGNDTGLIDHYSFTIEKVKADFAACGYPVDDQYDQEPDTISRTVIFDEINDPNYGRLKYEILHLTDDDDTYLDDLKEFIANLKAAIESGHGSPITTLAYHDEVRRRIAAKTWVAVLTWPAARALGALNPQSEHQLFLDDSLENLARLDRCAVRQRFSDEHLLDQVARIQNKLGKVTGTIGRETAYQRIAFQTHHGIITLSWQTRDTRHYSGKTTTRAMPASVADSLAGRLVDEVICHPLAQNLGLRVIEASSDEKNTTLLTDEKEEPNLIVLQRSLS